MLQKYGMLPCYNIILIESINNLFFIENADGICELNILYNSLREIGVHDIICSGLQYIFFILYLNYIK